MEVVTCHCITNSAPEKFSLGLDTSGEDSVIVTPPQREMKGVAPREYDVADTSRLMARCRGA